jgi:hypothetical protein
MSWQNQAMNAHILNNLQAQQTYNEKNKIWSNEKEKEN